MTSPLLGEITASTFVYLHRVYFWIHSHVSLCECMHVNLAMLILAFGKPLENITTSYAKFGASSSPNCLSYQQFSRSPVNYADS